MRLWGIDVSGASAPEVEYLRRIAVLHPEPPSVERMWALLDEVWAAHGASTDRLDAPEVAAFYRHPVWLVNGLFVEIDPESAGHRDAITRWLAPRAQSPVVDFGGGYGALARRLARERPDLDIQVVDPYPSSAALTASEPFRSIRYVTELKGQAGAIVAQDVLEHVADPIALAAHLVAHTRPGGLLVIANCFEPCIKCHVPATFHLRRTFPQLMRLLGCRPLGAIPGAAHALAFERAGSRRPPRAMLAAFAAYSRGRSRLAHWLRRR